MAGERSTQWSRRSLVEKDPHCPRSGLCEAQLGMLEDRLDLFPRNAGKPLEKLIEARPGLEILEQRFDGHAGSLEQPCAADLLRMPFNGRALAPVQHYPRGYRNPTDIASVVSNADRRHGATRWPES